MTMTIENPVMPTGTLADKTFYLKIAFGMFGNIRKVPTSQIEVKADNAPVTDETVKTDKAWLRVNKQLVQSKELEAIRRADGALRRWVYDMCLPSFDAGVYFAPKAAIEMIEKKLSDYRTERAELVEAFLLAYSQLRDEAKTRLGSLFNPTDYPAMYDVDKEFSYSWRYVSLGVPGALEEINADLFEREKEKAAQQMADATAEITQLMRVSLADMVSHLRDRLTDDSDGKRKKLHESAVEKIRDFLTTFDFRNVTDDVELADIVAQARDILDGTSIEALRTTDSLRETVREEMEEINAKLETLVIKSGRKIREDVED